MSGRLPDRALRLSNLRRTPRGFVRMAACLGCGHMAPLPLRDLIRRYGESCLMELAAMHLRCEECMRSKVEVRLVPLCEPGCHKFR